MDDSERGTNAGRGGSGGGGGTGAGAGAGAGAGRVDDNDGEFKHGTMLGESHMVVENATRIGGDVGCSIEKESPTELQLELEIADRDTGRGAGMSGDGDVDGRKEGSVACNRSTWGKREWPQNVTRHARR